jgi:ubiquinone/menaquinone biosynthesis C-methylase UbiE
MESAAGVSFKTYGGNAAENYDRYFVPVIGRPFAESLLAAAALQQGERVLDVACGTGVVSRLAAERVGAEGTVVGMDLNPGMLAVARSVTSQQPSIEWRQGSAEEIPLADESFDVVLCSLGLQFVPDKLKSLSEMRRVLVENGRLAINAVGPIPPAFGILEEALSRHVNPEVAAFMRAVFSLHDERGVQDLIERSGFANVSVKRETLRLVLPAPKDFLWQYISSTPLAGAVEQLDDARRAALEGDVVARWQQFIEGDALVSEPGVTVATAVRRKVT